MDARIVEVEARLIRLPLEEPRGDAIQKFTALELPTVRLKDAAGRTGLGFGYTIGTGGTSILELLEADLLHQLLGQDARRIGQLHHRLFESIHALTPGCLSSTALSAIDVALWDLAGHRTRTPLHVLLGGAKDKVLAYNTHVGWLNRPLDEMVELCKKAVKHDGFRAVKLKIGKPDPEEDRERVARVRETVGPHVTIFTDANQSWQISDAIARLKKLEPYDIGWIEEPLPATDLEGFTRLGEHTPIPRAGGESLYAPADFFHCVRSQALDILQPDIARIGGITSALQVCHLAQAANLKVAPHVSPELSIVLAAAVPNSLCVEFIPQMEPLLETKLKIVDGYAIPSDEPGHGIRFDPEQEEKYLVKKGRSLRDD